MATAGHSAPWWLTALTPRRCCGRGSCSPWWRLPSVVDVVHRPAASAAAVVVWRQRSHHRTRSPPLRLFGGALGAGDRVQTMSTARADPAPKAWPAFLAAEQLRRVDRHLLPARADLLVGIFDLWEAEMAWPTGANSLQIGDSPGGVRRDALARPCAVVSLGSIMTTRTSEAATPRAAARAYCRSTLRAPHLATSRSVKWQHGARHRRERGAAASPWSTPSSPWARHQRVVPARQRACLLYGQYGWQPGQAGHLSAVKVDIEGHEDDAADALRHV